MNETFSKPEAGPALGPNYEEDFEEWCRRCVRVEDKLTGRAIPFVLNAAQRRVASILEDDRRAGRPIRIIMLKARQWGGSTLVQVYMAWMQLVRHRGWNSVICAHVKDASAGIRGMYSRLLREYPEEMKSGKGKDWVLSPYEKSSGVVEIASRECRITLASAGAPNSVRGSNFAMAHLSEVAFWGEGECDSGEEIVRTICGSVPRIADSLIVMESTANGKGNYFYREWQRAVAGESDKRAVFVPWHEIEIYRRDVSDEERATLPDSLTDYELELLDAGVDIEAVAWYHDKRKEYATDAAMMAEFPSTAEEAFRAGGDDATFVEEELPELKEATSGEGEWLGVVMPGKTASECIFERFKMYGDGTTVCYGSETLSTTLGGLAARVADWSRREGGTVAVVSAVGCAGSASAEWLAGRMSEQGATMHCDEDENEVYAVDDGKIACMLATHHEQTRSGRVIETDADAMDEYREFRESQWREMPGIVARLVGVEIACGLPAGVDISDFRETE